MHRTRRAELEPEPVYDDDGDFDVEAWMDELEDRVKNPRRVVIDDDEPAPTFSIAEVVA